MYKTTKWDIYDTPFSLTFGTGVAITKEASFLTLRSLLVATESNEEQLHTNLDFSMGSRNKHKLY